jgi:adenine phosphoribosyltransferase
MSIKSKIRTIPDYPLKGIMFRDIATLLADPLGLNEVVKKLAQRYSNNKYDFKYIVGIEARGFIVGAALAYALNKGFIMIRKPGKLPGKVISEEYQLEYGTDKIEMHEDAFEKGSKVILFDDLLATGGTMLGAANLIEKLGGKIEEMAVVINLPDIGGEAKLKDRGYEVSYLCEFEGD